MREGNTLHPFVHLENVAAKEEEDGNKNSQSSQEHVPTELHIQMSIIQSLRAVQGSHWQFEHEHNLIKLKTKNFASKI